MLDVVRIMGWRGVPSKKLSIEGIGQGKRSTSDFSSMARLTSADTGLPWGSVVFSVTSTSSPG